MSFVTSPLDFVGAGASGTGGREFERAVDSLKRYYFEPGWVGRHFDAYVASLDPWKFTEADFFAVSMLSVSVPPETGLALLADAECTSLLKEISVDARIDDVEVALNEHSPANRLWDLLRAQPGFGPTITSKLMAAKRPHLIPIHDTHVSQALMRGRLKGEWGAWRETMMTEEARNYCTSLREASGVRDYVSDLRLLDVVVWMRVHGDTRFGDDQFWLD